MTGQGPHLDYPYYRHLWPKENGGCMSLPVTHMLSLQIVTLITLITLKIVQNCFLPCLFRAYIRVDEAELRSGGSGERLGWPGRGQWRGVT